MQTHVDVDARLVEYVIVNNKCLIEYYMYVIIK